MCNLIGKIFFFYTTVFKKQWGTLLPKNICALRISIKTFLFFFLLERWLQLRLIR